jgi:hypothetical protein
MSTSIVDTINVAMFHKVHPIDNISAYTAEERHVGLLEGSPC